MITTQSKSKTARAIRDRKRRYPHSGPAAIAAAVGVSERYVRRTVRRMEARMPPKSGPKQKRILAGAANGEWKGKTYREIGEIVGAHFAYVRKVLRNPAKAPPSSERRILDLHNSGRLMGKTASEIADMTGISRDWAQALCTKNGIRPFREMKMETADELAEMANNVLGTNYADGSDMLVKMYWRDRMTLEAIGKKLGTCAQWVRNWMILLGVPRRPKGHIMAALRRREKEGGGEVNL
jgi:hypothetical protein